MFHEGFFFLFHKPRLSQSEVHSLNIRMKTCYPKHAAVAGEKNGMPYTEESLQVRVELGKD